MLVVRNSSFRRVTLLLDQGDLRGHWHWDEHNPGRIGCSRRIPSERTTVLTLHEKYQRSEPIAMLTAYDYPTALALDEAGIDAILVGDSLAMVVLGLPDTLAVTMEEMLHHARAVSRGARRALLIGDMHFLSYQADHAEAVRNAGRFLKEGGMNAVKLEGGGATAQAVRWIRRRRRPGGLMTPRT
ncbi:MAG TPA: 3-methyl-2-oxobutanoate hydroxymethyltransferase [Acidobacteriota bacterium]|nr:3-methyl-2-oxobutanoate hydroxymethyltransferase [Acidobacteriota bacterium]